MELLRRDIVHCALLTVISLHLCSPSVNSCKEQSNINGIIVDCSHKNLDSVPNLPKDSIIIRLDNNHIASIQGQPFIGMYSLLSLNISRNPLKYISPDMLKGLGNLRQLIILNSLLMDQLSGKYGRMDIEYLFSDTNLTEFGLTSSNGDSYLDIYIHPCTVFNISGALKFVDFFSLEIDTYVFFLIENSPETSRKSKTEKLVLWNDYTCAYHSFSGSSFHAFSGLADLTIHNSENGNVGNTRFEVGALSRLIHLKSLYIGNRESLVLPDVLTVPQSYDMTWTIDQLLYNVTKSVSGLENLDELHLDKLHLPYTKWFLNCSLALSSLRVSKSLTTLSLNGNSLSFRKCNSVVLPPSLKHLDIRENCLWVIGVQVFLSLHDWLTTVDARNQNWCGSSTKMPSKGYEHELFTIDSDNISRNFNVPSNFISPLQTFKFSHSNYGYHYWYSDFLPRTNYVNMDILEMAWLKDYPGFSLTLKREFLTILPVIRYLDLTGSKINRIDIDAFQNLSHLQTLRLSSNDLGMMGYNLSDAIQVVHGLNNLQIANNGIQNLKEDIFNSMFSLEHIDISGNQLATLNSNIGQLRTLKFLNISNNQFNFLSHKTRAELDMIRQYSQVVVDLRQNPLLCSCDTLDFLKWLRATKVVIVDKGSVTCSTSTGKRISMNETAHIINTLDSACVSDIFLVLSCSIAGTVCIASVAALLIYKNKWRLRYLYYMTKLRFQPETQQYNRIFDYDAFISYASEDYEIARRGCIENLEDAKEFRLFIHERDFVPGESIAYNISIGIHSSKMTVFFVSEAFLLSEWCLYEFNIARMESLYTKRTVMLIVIVEKSVISKLPLDILDVIRRVTYLEYPEHGDSKDLSVFWSKLSGHIQQN